MQARSVLSIGFKPVRTFPKGILQPTRSRIRSQTSFQSASARRFTSSAIAAKAHSDSTSSSRNPLPSTRDAGTWGSYIIWKRAGINTMRCLVGCTLGDFSMLWYLQGNFPGLDMGVTMGLSMAAGLITSLALETVLLKMGPDALKWGQALSTAASMSIVSMVAMEATQNLVDVYLTGGVVAYTDPRFWFAAGISMSAGFLVPLPYNYLRLRKYGKACH